MALPEINVVLTATADRLNAVVANAAQRLDGFGKGADAAGKRLALMADRLQGLGAKLSFASAGMVAGAAGLAAIVKGAAEAGDKIGNAAKAAGLSAEKYQEMAFALGEAAEITEDEFGAAMVKLNQRLGDAQQGSTGAIAAFEAVGISAADIASGAVGSEEALAGIVAKLEATADPALAAALATDLFGKAGGRMGATLAGQEGAVAGFADRARELGLIVSGDFVKNSQKFGDKMSELGKQFDLLKIQIADRLLPAILNELIPALQDHVFPAFETAIKWVGGMMDAFAGLPGPVQDAALLVAGAFAVGGPMLLAVGAAVSIVSTAMTAISLPIVAVGAVVVSAGLIWAKWGDDIKASVGGAVDFISKRFQLFIEDLERVIEKAKAVGKAISDALSLGRSEMNSGSGYGGIGGAGDDSGGAAFSGGSGDSNLGGNAGADLLGTDGFVIGQNMAQGMVLGISTGLLESQDALRAQFQSIPLLAREELQVNSPSEVFAQIGRFIGDGLALGISESAGRVADATRGMTGGAVAATSEGATQILGALGNLFAGSKKISAGLAKINAFVAFTEVLKDPSFIGRPWARIGAAAAALQAGLGASRSISGDGGGSASAGASAAAAPAPPPTIANINWYGPMDANSFGSLTRQLNAEIRGGYVVNFREMGSA